MKKFFALIFMTLVLDGFVSAQCSSVNTAFKSGETLSYDLYFNWKFIWVKAGTASFNITRSIYNGEPAYRTRLVTRGSKRADAFFVMRDTLVSYVDTSLVPLYYRKGAEEGKSYREDEVWYSYHAGRSAVKMRHQRNGSEPKFSSYSSTTCMFDMLSMLLRARSFDAGSFKKGHTIPFVMADGTNCDPKKIIYKGKSTFQVENSTAKYRCLVFSFLEKEDGVEKEIVTFYVTDDDNHVPVRLDMNLRFGSAKAYLSGMKGLRNPLKAKIK